MAMQVFQTQISDSKEWAGLTLQNHLGWLGMEQPSFLNDTIRVLYKYGSSGDDFINFVNQFPEVEVPDSMQPHRWMFAGATEKNVPLQYASTSLANALAGTAASGTTQLGINGSSFWMVFGERYFSNREVIVGSRPMAFSLRIMGEPTQFGSKWAYEVTIYGTSNGEGFFVPLDDVAAGTRWSADFAPVSNEFSRGGSEVKYNSYWMLENFTSQIRKQMICSGSMLSAGSASHPLLFKFVHPDGKVDTLWIDYQMWKFIQSFRADQARLLLFGRTTKNADGSVSTRDTDSGHIIQAGRGFYEQIGNNNIYKYTDFNIRNLEKILMELSYNKLGINERKFILMTGQYGASQFYRAMKNEAAAVPYLWNNQQLSFGADGNGTFKAGSINKYVWWNGIEVTVVIDPTKDNAVRNSALHPDGGLMSSYEYDIVYNGETANGANVKRLKVKGLSETYGYKPGLRDPYTPGAPLSSPKLMVSSVDGYEIHGMYWGGLTIEDPSKVARLVPAYLY